jgi:hypothetical protein
VFGFLVARIKTPDTVAVFFNMEQQDPLVTVNDAAESPPRDAPDTPILSVMDDSVSPFAEDEDRLSNSPPNHERSVSPEGASLVSLSLHHHHARSASGADNLLDEALLSVVDASTPRGRAPVREMTYPMPARCINPASDINARLDTQVEVRVYPCNNSQSGKKKVRYCG